MKVAKPAAKTAVKKAAKTAAADKPEKATKTRAKKAEDKLADLVGSARPAPAAAVLVVRPRTPTMIPTASTIRWTAKAKSCRPEAAQARRQARQGRSQDLIARGPVSAEEYEARRNRLKQLIKLGKDRGYLTYGEINDHLPDDLVDAEAIDGIISTFSDMGIAVMTRLPTLKRC